MISNRIHFEYYHKNNNDKMAIMMSDQNMHVKTVSNPFIHFLDDKNVIDL